MNERPNPAWGDEKLVEYIRHWAIERWKCGLDGFAADRINRKHLFPCQTILQERGPHALAKLLPLLHDDNRDVQLTAASFAYDADRPACQKALLNLLQTLDLVGLTAWLVLSDKEGPDAVPDPATIGRKSS